MLVLVYTVMFICFECYYVACFSFFFFRFLILVRVLRGGRAGTRVRPFSHSRFSHSRFSYSRFPSLDLERRGLGILLQTSGDHLLVKDPSRLPIEQLPESWAGNRPCAAGAGINSNMLYYNMIIIIIIIIIVIITCAYIYIYIYMYTYVSYNLCIN